MNEQLMRVALPKGLVDAYHKSRYGNITHLFAAGNIQRGAEGLAPLNISLVLRAKKTIDFMQVLSNESGVPLGDLIKQTGAGKARVTTGHMYLIVYLAERLSAKFHYHVIHTFLQSEIFRLSDECGDAFKALNIVVDAYLPNKEGKSNTYININIAKMLRAKIFDEVGENWNTREQGNIWNSEHATGDKHGLRCDHEDKLILFLKMGCIRDWSHLKEIINKL